MLTVETAERVRDLPVTLGWTEEGPAVGIAPDHVVAAWYGVGRHAVRRVRSALGLPGTRRAGPTDYRRAVVLAWMLDRSWVTTAEVAASAQVPLRVAWFDLLALEREGLIERMGSGFATRAREQWEAL